MQANEINNLISNILSKLTGDYETDIKYLDEQTKIYKDHENSREILRGIGRAMAEITPDDKKEELRKYVNNDLLKKNVLIDEANFYIYKKDFENAYSLLNENLTKFEESGFFVDDEVSEYHYFPNGIEKILYLSIIKPKKKCRDAIYNLGEMYRLLGYTLIELGRTEEAKKALEKGIKWNPMDLEIKFEYYETFKLEDKDRFLKSSKDAMKIAFQKKDIARIYRNIGFTLIEMENYEPAAYSYLLSNTWEPNERNASELYYIQQESGIDYGNPTPEHLFKCLEENDIPIGPDKDVVVTLYQVAMAFEEQKFYSDALNTYMILNDLIEDDEISNKIEKLKVLKEN